MHTSNRKVLLVDDQDDVLSELRGWLEPHYEVHVARDGVSALGACRQHGPFAVVVSDFAMPGMSGIELFGELRREWPDTLRVMLTGMADLSLALEALEQGAIFRFLTKPARRERFLGAIADAVARFVQHAEERLFTEQLVFVQESLRAFNETLEARLEGAQQEREEARRTILRALEALARYRDDETGEHLVRVSEYSRFLATALASHPSFAPEIDEAFIEDMALAAPLHDIGKVAIPDAILFKPGKLDADEWDVMRTHAQVGADILRGAMESSRDRGCLRVAHDLAGTHHERWDGGGYPNGLKGREIPLAGRIMSLVDCYDALTSERPYKRAWSHREAVDYLRGEAGKAYDPQIVAVFLEREREIGELMGKVHVAGAA